MFTKSALATAVMASSAMANQFVMYTPRGDDTAVERIDQIINPGVIAAHVHQLFGSGGMSNDMTYESLQNSRCTTVGSADGHGNSQDHSVYWHPALYAEAIDGSGLLRIPTNGHKLYYRDDGHKSDKLAEPFEFPKGFRMVAGDKLRRAPYDGQAKGITQWFCHGNGDRQDPGFPADVTDCPQYPGFNGAIHFPHCWNGNNFDLANPDAHMSYPEGDPQAGPCPSSHPIRLPHIFIENEFDVHSVAGKFKPGTFTLSQGDPTGYGWHMDFFNGWEQGAIPALLKSCVQGQYGNEDVGVCSAFKPGSANKDCKLTATYIEKLDNPGPALPGCNPITKENPAPKMAIAALGVATTNCGIASGGNSTSPPSSDPLDGYPAPAPSSGSPSFPSSSRQSSSPSSTTKPPQQSSQKPSQPSAPAYAPQPSGDGEGSGSGTNTSKDNSNAPPPTITNAPKGTNKGINSDDDGTETEIVYETVTVTVTAAQPQGYSNRQRRSKHIRRHANRMGSQ